MKQLTASQIAIVDRLVSELRTFSGVEAIVIGGSHARGRARPDSDIDIGLYYRRESAFSIDGVRQLAGRVNDTPDPVVSGFLEWGQWVDGGSWLQIEGQRVDLLYRSLDKVNTTLADALSGQFEIDFEQQPPFGFFGPTLLGEVAVAVPLHDPNGTISALKARVSPMPDALALAVIQRQLWSVEFGLTAFAGKYAANGNTHGVAGCLVRFIQALVLTLFAMNRAYLVNDKTALAEIDEFAIAPDAFGSRVSATLAQIGSTPETLLTSVAAVTALFEDVRRLAGSSYTPVWRF